MWIGKANISNTFWFFCANFLDLHNRLLQKSKAISKTLTRADEPQYETTVHCDYRRNASLIHAWEPLKRAHELVNNITSTPLRFSVLIYAYVALLPCRICFRSSCSKLRWSSHAKKIHSFTYYGLIMCSHYWCIMGQYWKKYSRFFGCCPNDYLYFMRE